MPKCVGGLLPCALLCVIRVLCGSIVLQHSRPAGGPSSVCPSPVSPCLCGHLPRSSTRRSTPMASTAVWGWTFVVVQDAISVYGVLPFVAARFVLAGAVLAPIYAMKLTRRSLLV